MHYDLTYLTWLDTNVYLVFNFTDDVLDSSPQNTHTDTLADHISNASSAAEHDGILQQQIQTQKQLKEAEDSWEDLKGDLEQLNTVIHEFATHVNVSTSFNS